MGQKTNPIGNRLGIIRGWESNWYGGKNFADNVIEDEKIRNYVRARIDKGGIARIILERSMKRVTVTLHTSRPGYIIGKGGTKVDQIKEELKKITGKDFQINIVEIRKPEANAYIVGESIAKQIEGRMNYRRVIKMAIRSAMRANIEGIKIRVSGRLNGAEMARSEEYKEGRTPLHTFRADIDYALVEALTIYGLIGIKVWICNGEVLTKRDLSAHSLGANEAKGNDRRGGDRRGGRGDRRGDRRGGDRRGGRNS